MARKPAKHIKVWVSPSDDAAIRNLAASSGLSLSAYLRTTGLNKKVRSVIDMQAVAELAKVNGDIGRVAAKLKLAIESTPRDIGNLIMELRELQTKTHEIMGRIRNGR